MNSEKILPAIKLRYLKKATTPEKNGLKCRICGKVNILVGSYFVENGEEKSFVCEKCAIQRFKKENGFKTLRAATARRRRMFDVGYLFQEMVTDKFLFEKNLQKIDDLDDEQMDFITAISRLYFDEIFDEKEKAKLEETESQIEIEKKLQPKLKKVNFKNF